MLKTQLTEIGAGTSPMMPDLRIVSLDQIAPHELPAFVHGRELTSYLRADKMLRDPLIVHELGPGRYLKLDGTHRHRALIDLGCTHATVQVVNLNKKGAATLSVWANLSLVEEPVLMSILANEDLEMSPVAIKNVGQSLEPLACTIVFYGTDVAWEVRPGGSLPDTLHRIVGALRASCLWQKDLLRIVPPARGADVRTVFTTNAETKSANILILFEPIPVGHLQELVADPIPAGITRAIVWSGRAIGVNVPLRLLSSNSDDELRYRWLQANTGEKPLWLPPGAAIDGRPYDEGICLFDPNRIASQPTSSPTELTLVEEIHS